MNEILSIFLGNLPGLISGALTGIIVLLIEYKTGWFISVQNKTSVSHSVNPNRMPHPPHFLDLDWFELGFKFMFLLLVFTATFLILFGMITSILPSLPTTNTTLDNPTDPNLSVSTIGDGQSRSFFENKLFISVSNVYGDPAVTFIVGEPGYPSQQIERVSNGYSFIYEGKQKYEVRVTAIKQDYRLSHYVDFTVIKLP
jgi:hypothetical protein